ncbi:hypothetical protein ABTX60_15175 [Streptomyces sp. NPDC126510]|uniref:hypothetical protein n=1 Tax=Streptomyces sp. NPDC126510 TaxID=3155317 RepID=UPI003328DD5B
MRLKLRPAVHYAPLANGVYLAGAGAPFVFQGSPALFRIADVCLPLLEDGADEDILVEALGPRARPVVRKLLDALDAHGLLLRPDRLSVPEPDEATRHEFAEILAHLEVHSTDPYADFARLRTTRTVLAGPCDAVLPAARGLWRAGVRELVLAVDDPAVAERTGRRLGVPVHEVRVAEEAARHADAVVSFTVAGAEDPVAADALPATVTYVPVRLGGPLGQVGPVLRVSDAETMPDALWQRAVNWALQRRGEPPLRPASDALAGALAAELLLSALTTGPAAGQAHAPQAHALQGPGLTATPLSLPAAPIADTSDPVELVAAVTGTFLGPLAGETPYDLPQLPLALARTTAVDLPGRPAFTRWGDNQAEAALEAALEALRAVVAATEPRGVAAAGIDETRALLDGALRLLAERATTTEEILDPGRLPERPASLWRTLAAYELTPFEAESAALAGVDWRLVRLRHPDGRPLSAAWGPDTDTALTHALAEALTHVQAGVPATLGTAALSTADRSTLDTLRRQLARYGPTARRAAPDPLLGALPLWHGSVVLVEAGHG